MKILSIDTTTKFLNLAVADGDKLLAVVHKEAGFDHGALLLPMIDNTLRRAKVSLGKLDGIAISIGPGSFTGLRIAVATVKGLALVKGMKIAVVPTLDVIAQNYKGDDGYFAPILDARKGRVYSAIYEKKRNRITIKSSYFLTDIEGLIKYIKKRTVFFGDGLALYKDVLGKSTDLAVFEKGIDWYPRAEALAKLGQEKFRKKQTLPYQKLLPMYMYPKECGVKGFKI